MLPRVLRVFLLLFVPAISMAIEYVPLRELPFLISRPLVEGPDGYLYGVGNTLFCVSPDGSDFRECQHPGDLKAEVFVFGKDGNLYGCAGRRIFRMRPNGKFSVLRTISVPRGNYAESRCMVVAPSGDIYGSISTSDGRLVGAVYRIAKSGAVSFLPQTGEGGILGANTLTVGHDGAVWGAGGPGVFRIGPDGHVSYPVTGSVYGLTDLIAHPDGNFYGFANQYNSLDAVMYRIPPSGAVETLPGPGAPLLTIYQRMMLGGDGYIYGGYLDHRLVRLSTSGERLDFSPALPPGYARAQGLTRARDGSVYALLEGFSGSRMFARLELGEERALNFRPYAYPDFVRAPSPGKEIEIRVLANDVDVDGDSIRVVEATALHGSATVDPGGQFIRYVAPLGAEVTNDEITYSIEDTAGNRSTPGQVMIRRGVRGHFAAALPHSDPQRDGFIQVGVTGRGTFTGRLWLGGYGWSFAGAFDVANRATVSLADERIGTVQLAINYFEEEHPARIGVTFTHAGASRMVELSRPNIAAGQRAAGAYTWMIPPASDWLNEPERVRFGEYVFPNPLYRVSGYGVGSMQVLSNGMVRFAGRLPNGQPIATSNPMDATGGVSLFAYKSRFPESKTAPGSWVSGRVTFGERKGISDADGPLRWNLAAPMFDLGFQPPLRHTSVSFLASRVPGGNTLADALKTNTLRFDAKDGGFSRTIGADVLANGSGITSLGANFVKGTFNRRSGLVTGNFIPSGWSLRPNFYGVVFSSQRLVVGQFKAVGLQGTGSIRIAPR